MAGRASSACVHGNLFSSVKIAPLFGDAGRPSIAIPPNGTAPLGGQPITLRQ